jgi:signal transduction histidine kinase
MTLVPRSLFGRLVAVLLAGLVVTQLASFAIHMQERRDLLAQASGMHAAQRIADIVRLLDPLGDAERARLAAILSAPPMAIRLGPGPMPAAPEDADRRARTALFGAVLRRALGEEFHVQVAVTQFPGSAGPQGPPTGGMPGAGMGMWNHMRPGQGMGPGMMGMGYLGQPALALVAQVRLSDGTLVTFDSRQPASAENLPYRLLASLAVLLVGVVLVSLLAVRWATRPLNTLADAAEELGRDIQRPPLPEAGPVEVRRAARAFNTMQSRLARFIGDRTRIFAAMSHDLKTPITRLRLRAELLDDPTVRAKFAADLAEMESMVGSTLDFLRGLESAETARPIDVAALLESLQADFSEGGAKVSVEAAGLRPYPGRAQALKRCLANLVENAVKYGGAAKVTALDGNDRLEIRIRDEGPGIAEAELDRVFDPFYRVEASRNRETGGTGLGLTIARSIARGHGGDVVLRNHPEGGLEATLTLPR